MPIHIKLITKYDNDNQDKCIYVQIILAHEEPFLLINAKNRVIKLINQNGALAIYGPIIIGGIAHEANFIDYILNSKYVDKMTRDRAKKELFRFNKLIDIIDPTSKAVDALTKLDLPPFIDIEIKVS